MGIAQGIRDAYTGGRNSFAQQLFGVGGHGATPGDPSGTGLHFDLSKRVMSAAPPETWPMVAPLLQGYGIGNEIVGGITEAAQGNPFFSPNGFDTNDIAANMLGAGTGMAQQAGFNPETATGNQPPSGAPGGSGSSSPPSNTLSFGTQTYSGPNTPNTQEVGSGGYQYDPWAALPPASANATYPGGGSYGTPPPPASANSGFWSGNDAEAGYSSPFYTGYYTPGQGWSDYNSGSPAQGWSGLGDIEAPKPLRRL